jgi:hypothetical protein
MAVKAPKQTDTRLAEELLGLLPRLGQVWADAVRASHEDESAAATANLILILDRLSADQRSRLHATIGDLNVILATPPASKETRNVR